MNFSDQSAKAVIDPAVRPMRHALGLNNWRVDIEYGVLGERLGECVVNATYQRGTVTIDPAQHESEDELLDTLRHELLHLIHGDFETCRRITAQFIEGDSFDAMDVGWHLGAERTVLALERLLDSLGLGPRELVAKGREQMGEVGDG